MKTYNKYKNDLIFEKLDRICEEYSFWAYDGFKDTLMAIKNQEDNSIGTIAYEILNIINWKDNGDMNINYLDIHHNPKTDAEYKSVTFVPDKVVVKTATEDGGWSNASDLPSYGAIQRLAMDQKKQNMKIGKLIQKLLPLSDIKFTNRDIEGFVNAYISIIKSQSNDYDFQILKGEDVRKGYEMGSIVYQRGTLLSNSCMLGENPDFFDIYAYNSDVCSMLVLKNKDDKIVGRSFLWKTDDGVTIMDRIYTHKDYMVDIFKDYAKDNEIAFKQHNDYTHKNEFVVNGEKVFLRLKVSLKKNRTYDYYPYMDTFSYFNKRTKTLYNYDSNMADLTLNSTEGHYAGWDEDDEEDGNGYDEPQYEIGYYGEEIYDGDAEFSRACDSYVNNSGDDPRYILMDYHLQSQDVGMRIIEWTTAEATKTTLCTVDGKYYYIKHCVWSDYDNTYINRRDAIYLKGEYVHWDHQEEYLKEHPEKR